MLKILNAICKSINLEKLYHYNIYIYEKNFLLEIIIFFYSSSTMYIYSTLQYTRWIYGIFTYMASSDPSFPWLLFIKWRAHEIERVYRGITWQLSASASLHTGVNSFVLFV